MAQYKVPQDVEADDKLLGPFSFRQFVYLMVAAGLCFVAFLLFQVFPLLVIIPIPFIFFLGILALPLKKDQPMETYLSAVVDFYLKPHTRIWMPGQSDTTITITAPKYVEDSRTKDLSQEEASHRLSFLANIVDTEGYAIKETNSNLRDDVASEAAATKDMFETNQNYNLNQTLEQSAADRHAQLVEQMRNAINQNSIYGAAAAPAQTPQISHQITTPTPAPVSMPAISTQPQAPSIAPQITQQFQSYNAQPVGAPVDVAASAATIQPDMEEIHEALTAPVEEENQDDASEENQDYISEDTPAEEQSEEFEEAEPTPPPIPEPEPVPEPAPKESSAEMIELANNTDFSIETIAKQARRIQEKEANDNEVYISLH